MASVLDFERYKNDLERQLLRRIGYTNGLHKIHRFARIVEYLYPLMTTSRAVLAQIIIREENKRASGKDRQLKGKRYAAGIVDVAGALGLLERFAGKIALSSQGYACHAINELMKRNDVLDSFLLEKVIESDGEYTLNILRLVNEGKFDTNSIGDALIARFFSLIDLKSQWAQDKISDRFSQRTILAILNRARTTLQNAVGSTDSSKGNSGIEFFYKHIINPRLEWLHDLGCLESHENIPISTERGKRLLAQIHKLGGWYDNVVLLPLDSWLASHLGLPNLYVGGADEDFTWRLVASTRVSRVETSRIHTDHSKLLERIKSIYTFVKLVNFNEADASSIQEVLASTEAVEGRVLPQHGFEQALVQLVAKFPGEIYKLSKRRGKGLYVALKANQHPKYETV